MNSDIYAMDEDGGSLTRITDSIEEENNIVISPDLNLIAFSRSTDELSPAGENFGYGRDLFISATDGSGAELIASLGFRNDEPAFSPDGSRIAFSVKKFSEPDWSDTDIYIVGRDGSNPHMVTMEDEWSESHPQWFSDGLRLLYLGNAEAARSAVFMLDLNSSNRVSISDSLLSGNEFYWVEALHLSPDNRYVSVHAVLGGVDAHSDVIQSIAILDMNGSVIKVLNRGDSNYFVSWSQDSSMLYFISTGDSHSSHNFTYNLYRYDLIADKVVKLIGGSKIRNLTYPSSSPDYSKVAYVEWDPIDTGSNILHVGKRVLMLDLANFSKALIFEGDNIKGPIIWK
jgi:Tol biopolymer transport system component